MKRLIQGSFGVAMNIVVHILFAAIHAQPMQVGHAAGRNDLYTSILPGFSDPAWAEVNAGRPSMQRIREKLEQDDILVEFYLSDTALLVLTTSCEDVAVSRRPVDALFWSSLRKFRRTLKSAEIGGMTRHGRILYSYLIAPVDSLICRKKKMVIVPGRYLAGIPFEAMVRDLQVSPDGKVKEIRYLIRDHEVSYHFSASDWVESGAGTIDFHPFPPVPPDITFLAFAPGFQDDRHVDPLPQSGREIHEIGTLFREHGHSSRLLLDHHSRELLFREMAARSRFLHLATHRLTDSCDPDRGGFLFAGYDPEANLNPDHDGILTLREICQLRLNTELIVLNACASGTEVPGREQVTASFPHGFLKAGARNIISSLWNVTDQVAGHFAVAFYRTCLAGKRYSEALREVKLDMLRHRETSLPTVWAAYVLTGE